ncbi:MAG: MFS transporter [Actinomycetota bacterium]
MTTTDLDPDRSVWAELRRLVPPLYVPVAMMTLGVGIILPLVPLYLEDTGLGLATVGVVIGAFGVGAALVGIPASAFAERRTNDHLLLVAIAASATSIVLFGFTEIAVLLVLARFVTGSGFGALGQSRQLFITRGVPLHFRGRVNSGMGGTHRLALAIGPVIGGAVADAVSFRAAFALSGIVMAIGAVFWLLPGGREDQRIVDAAPPVAVRAALRRHRGRIARGGIGPMLIQAGREGRYVVIPLVADRLGLSITEIGGLLAVGTVIDFVVFPVSGVIMDRFGRLTAIVPSFTIMAIGLVLLGLADDATDVAIASVLIGAGNGASSGAVLTLGADLAPEGEEGPYLAGFTLVSNLGLFLGPVVVGGVADAAGLDVSAFVLGGILLAGVAWIVIVIGETGGRLDVERQPRSA